MTLYNEPTVIYDEPSVTYDGLTIADFPLESFISSASLSIGGTPVLSPDFSAQKEGTTSFGDSQGNTWGLQGDAQILCFLVPEECECAVGDSSCITVDGAGTTDSPLMFSPILDQSPKNLLECGPNGLRTQFSSLFTEAPAIRRRKSSAQTFTRDIPAIIQFNITVFNSDSMASGPGLVVNTPGVYFLAVNVIWGVAAGSNNQDHMLSLLVDGSVLAQTNRRSPTNVLTAIAVETEAFLDVGQMVQARTVYSAGDATKPIAISDHVPSLVAVWLRERP